MSVCSQSQIRRINDQILHFLPDGTTEVRIFDFYFRLDELEPEQKEKLSANCRQAITAHWLAFLGRRGIAVQRSLSAATTYQAELRDLNRSRAPQARVFEFKDIAGGAIALSSSERRSGN